MPPARARAAVAFMRGARVTSIDGAAAHGEGLRSGARLLSSAPSLRAAQRRAVPACALYLTVPFHIGRALAVPPAHARAAVAVTRGARIPAITGAAAHGAKPWVWRPLLDLSSVATPRLASCRTGARALSCSAVPRWRCYSRASSTRPRCCCIHARSARDLRRWSHSALTGLGGWRPPPERSTVVLHGLAPHRTGARALSCHAVLHW